MRCAFETLHESLGFVSFNMGRYSLRSVRVTDFGGLV